ncbi:MAG: TetR family transcriptional regulator [Lachnospiraceae bacterium]|nr:TetR family transcriptional regulator [Lachnospiraceae bacterium]
MKKRTSKEIFAEVLLELSATQPVDKITVKEIVEKSGLSLQTFYNHFTDKYELILWVHKSKGQELIAKLESGSSYDEIVAENLQFYLEHKDFFQNAFTNTENPDGYGKMSGDAGYQLWKEHIMRRFSLDSLPGEIDFYLKMYCFASVRMTAEWAFNLPELPSEVFAAYMKECMPLKLRPYMTN